MEISNAHEHEAMSSHDDLEELLITSPAPEKKARLPPEQALQCPRCDSTNTKFCYYNNYSLSQPRYFCKSCRRYWTKGGSLRNIPVGGGCRKNKRSSSSSPPSTSSSSSNSITLFSKRPQFYNHDDLTTLAFARHLWPSLSDHEQFFLGLNPNPNPNPNFGISGGFLNFMRSGFHEPSNINGFHQICYGNDGSVVEEVEGSNQSSIERSCKVLMDLEMTNGVDHGGLGMEYYDIVL